MESVWFCFDIWFPQNSSRERAIRLAPDWCDLHKAEVGLDEADVDADHTPGL